MAENTEPSALDLRRRARAARNAGDRELALADERAAVALLRLDSPGPELAHAVRHVADILVELDRAEEATAAITEALALYRAIDAPPLDIANAMRSAAVHAEAIGDKAGARELWCDARTRYAALSDVFSAMTGSPANPGVDEATMRLAALGRD